MKLCEAIKPQLKLIQYVGCAAISADTCQNHSGLHNHLAADVTQDADWREPIQGGETQENSNIRMLNGNSHTPTH